MPGRVSAPLLRRLVQQARDGDRVAKKGLEAIKEHDFSVLVARYARDHSWLCHYERQSGYMGSDGKWRGSGPKGRPDLTLVRRNGDGTATVLFAELKREGGKLSEDQMQWIAELDSYGRVWRPSDWPEIEEELR